jgi:hypothetical protein
VPHRPSYCAGGLNIVVAVGSVGCYTSQILVGAYPKLAPRNVSVGGVGQVQAASCRGERIREFRSAVAQKILPHLWPEAEQCKSDVS